MRLIQLELNNIKSYKYEVINFSEGINCILGLNGSGKSTIIESIGSVLFNYNQRTSNNLLRYNENKGSISLSFEGNDNIIYQVVKTIRSKGNGNVKIIDVENKQVLQENVSDVYQFIKKVLNVPKEKSLAKLFEEIIAVPQGNFVNAFLETPKNRKENFDKLFELDIYKKLADDVKELSDVLKKEYIYKLDKKKAELNGKLNNYDVLIDEEKKLKGKINSDNNELKELNILYNKKEQEKNELNTKKEQIDNLIKKNSDLKNKIISINEKISINKEHFLNASEAKKVLLENEYGYNLYLKNTRELEQNEKINKMYLLYKEKYNDNKANIISYNEKNTLIKEIIKNSKVEHGKNRQSIIDKTKENEDKTNENKELEQKYIITNGKIKLLNEQITQEKSNYKIKIERLKEANQFLLSYNKPTISSDFNEKIIEIEKKLEIIKTNKELIVEKEKEKIKISSELENLKNNIKCINNEYCPILQERCLNIRGLSLQSEISKMIEDKERILSLLTFDINQLTNYNTVENELVKEKEFLLLEESNYKIDNQRYNEVLDTLKKNFGDEIENINDDNNKFIISELIKKYDSLYENYSNEEFDNLKKAETSISNTIFSNKNIININNNNIHEIEQKNKDIECEVIKKENEFTQNQFEIDKRENENKQLEQLLDSYQNIEQKIEENKTIINNNKNRYELYISKKEEANNISKYETAINELTKENESINCENQVIEEQIDLLNKTFSNELLDKLLIEINTLSKKIASLLTTLKLNNERLEKLSKEIDILNNIIKEKEKVEQDLEKYMKLDNDYKIIRDVFSNLPRELSKQIRKYIGIYASSIYRKISNENVRIELYDDYEVNIIDCIDETKIKTLSQLSGGEQMSVAIAIRLAMLKQITNIDLYFMDEPTINLDFERRMMVAEVVKDISNELRQLYVISHDDTFENITDNTIKICKVNNESRLDN